MVRHDRIETRDSDHIALKPAVLWSFKHVFSFRSRSMRLTLVRHGHARRSLDATLPDDARVLSETGRDAVRATAATLAAEGIQPDTVWSSPLTRALQTAELLLAGLENAVPVEVLSCLEPDGDIGELLARLSELPDDTDLLLTSHAPLANRLTSILTSLTGTHAGKADALRMELEKAEPGAAKLLWHWQSKTQRKR